VNLGPITHKHTECTNGTGSHSCADERRGKESFGRGGKEVVRGGGTQSERRGSSPQPGSQVYDSPPPRLLSLRSSRQRILFGHRRSPVCSSAMALLSNVNLTWPTTGKYLQFVSSSLPKVNALPNASNRAKKKKPCFGNPEAVLYGRLSLTSRGSRTINLPTTTSYRVF
jgi:hypothetical protein